MADFSTQDREFFDPKDYQDKYRIPRQPVSNPGYEVPLDVPDTRQTPASPGQPAAPAVTNPYAGLDQRDTFYKVTGTQQGSSFSPAQLKAKEGELAAQGFTLMPSADGTVQKVRAPNGMIVDVIQGAMTGKNIAQWLQPDQGGAGGPGGAGGATQGAFGGGSGGAGGFGGYGTNAQRDELYNTLMQRSNQGLNINAQTDPNIRQQADPYAAQVERERRRYMADTAERMGPLANIQGESRLASERAGQASGLFESQLIGREMQARRDEIAQALASRQGMLSQEQQLAMQRELAQLDAQIRNRQISSGEDQFLGSLGLQSENQSNYWDALRSGLIGG